MRCRHLILSFPTIVVLAACDAGPGTEDALSPLLAHAEKGDLPALVALLADGQTADVTDACRWTPLMKAALNGHFDTVEKLLEAGASTNAQDKGGYTAMMLAASNDHAKVTSLLLANGAQVDHQELTNGWTALIWTAKQGHLATVQALLEQGADTTLRDYSGRNAAEWAREAGHAQILALLSIKHPQSSSRK